MKRSRQCPKCQSLRLWHVRDVAANDQDIGSLQVHQTFQVAVIGKGPRGRAGTLEAFACQECRYVELYLKEPLVADGKYIQAIG